MFVAVLSDRPELREEFFKKLLKKDVKIMTGLKNKEKILKIM